LMFCDSSRLYVLKAVDAFCAFSCAYLSIRQIKIQVCCLSATHRDLIGRKVSRLFRSAIRPALEFIPSPSNRLLREDIGRVIDANGCKLHNLLRTHSYINLQKLHKDTIYILKENSPTQAEFIISKSRTSETIIYATQH
jgi:hypothetical protein